MTEFRPGRWQILPPVVKNLIIINAIMVFAQFVLGKYGIDLADHLGLHYWKSELFRPWQFITHMFMHGSYNDFNGTLLHIFFNMFMLWMFGSVLENWWGAQRFIIFYLICGLGAAVLHLLVLSFGYAQLAADVAAYQQNPGIENFKAFGAEHGLHRFAAFQNIIRLWQGNPDSVQIANESSRLAYDFMSVKFNEATVGASGAVFGILFAFGYLFPNTLLYIYFLVPVKAKYVVAGLALFELFSGIRNSAGDNVAHFAHLGGMLIAFILLKVWNKRNRNHFY